MVQFLFLTDQKGNTKFKKSKDYVNLGLSLAPHHESGFNTCPKASYGCIKSCLFESGHSSMKNSNCKFNYILRRRIEKTRQFFTDNGFFMDQLIIDIIMAKLHYRSKKLAIRLNTYSDIPWAQVPVNREQILELIYKNFNMNNNTRAMVSKIKKRKHVENIFQAFPEIQFYDYTKCFDRLTSNKQRNYYLVFSRSGNLENEEQCKLALKKGYNVAVVFKTFIPPKFYCRPVLPGDYDDLRFLDKRGKPGYVIGLLAKARAKKDKDTGFVIQTV